MAANMSVLGLIQSFSLGKIELLSYLMFYFISKSTYFLLKLNLHCKLPNYRRVSDTSEAGVVQGHKYWFCIDCLTSPSPECHLSSDCPGLCNDCNNTSRCLLSLEKHLAEFLEPLFSSFLFHTDPCNF